MGAKWSTYAVDAPFYPNKQTNKKTAEHTNTKSCEDSRETTAALHPAAVLLEGEADGPVTQEGI